jgi:3-methylfumaryl-CoA hydratase
MAEENYPGLIVHGPLLATLLMELVRLNAHRPVKGYRFRAVAPVFDVTPFRLVGMPAGDKVTLVAERSDGVTAMQAEATLE